MPDAIKATIDLMESDRSKLTVHSAYNMGGMSITPMEIHQAICKHIPGFQIEYKPDFRQVIAETWPQSIDDSVSARDWGYSYHYDLEKITAIMIEEISKKLNLSELE